jgi:hypothetical protein
MSSIDWDPFYTLSGSDIQGLIFGGFAGLGYTATLFLPNCNDAGFEMAASAFNVYHYWSSSGYNIIERVLVPIPDIIQILLSIYYMFACITKSTNTTLITALVQYTKYLQAAFSPYTIILTYLKGDRHDTFVAAFSLVKAIWNTVDATNYVLGDPLDVYFV